MINLPEYFKKHPEHLKIFDDLNDNVADYEY